MNFETLMLLKHSRIAHLFQTYRLGLLLLLLGNLAFFSQSVTAQDIAPDVGSEVTPDIELNADASDPDLGAIGEADNVEDLSPRLRPAANTGDLIGDFFSVSVTACTLDPELLDRKTPQDLAALGIASAGLISQTTPARPSLWWARERFGQSELVQNWLINTQAQRINLIVDRTRWTSLNYVERYRLVHQFGTIAREQGYTLRVFNTQPKCLAIYDCETVDTPNAQRQTCKVDMQPSRRDPFNFF
ncbi:MAG: hypothetical protein ACPGVO_09385 [Spirulinaceae cyanobacterium]